MQKPSKVTPKVCKANAVAGKLDMAYTVDQYETVQSAHATPLWRSGDIHRVSDDFWNVRLDTKVQMLTAPFLVGFYFPHASEDSRRLVEKMASEITGDCCIASQTAIEYAAKINAFTRKHVTRKTDMKVTTCLIAI